VTTVAIIQVRMTSTRLPGKVLADLAGQPLLGHMLARVRRTESLDGTWVATTANATDDPVVAFCEGQGVPVFRGDEADVLGRFAGAAAAARAELVVRLTADCPMMDPALIDEAVERRAAGGFDYLSNAGERTYPDGLDIEVFTRAALDEADREARLPFHREHVTPYLRTGLYTDIPTGRFKIGSFEAPADFSHLRWTVDTPTDLERVRAIVMGLPENYGWMDALALVTRRPELLNDRPGAAPPVALRAARAADSGLLFEWVNRPDSLAASFKTAAPVPRDTHEAWFAARLADAATGIWIAERAGAPVGQVRLQRRGASLEVSIYVDAAARGGGMAARMLDLVRAEAARRWHGLGLVARIKPDNAASRRLFTRAGYGRMVVERDHIVLHREPLSATKP
jgi:spore coat polysaccharide biosynthesis protein SpsF